MDPELEAFDREWKQGDRAKARELAKAFIAENRDDLMGDLRAAVRTVREAHLDDDPSITDLVQLVDAYREKGWAEDVLKVDMLLLADYEPQVIRGSVDLRRLFEKAG